MKIFILSSGKYGKRIVNHLATKLSSQIVGIHEVDEDVPEFIEDWEVYLPDFLPESDLIIAVGLKGDINLLVPDVARKTGAKSMIISLKDSSQVPLGLQKEIEEDAGDLTIVFAKPFCTLKPNGDKYIDEFTQHFGKPELSIDADNLIHKVTVLRGAPCGCTDFIATELEGMPVEDAELLTAEKFHNYPCLGSMAQDSQLNDTILHVAGYQAKEAVKRALGYTFKSAEVDEEMCMGGEGCDHLCLTVCPQVKAGNQTIIIKEDGKAYIDPASCGCCQLCMKECPYGCIELVEERIKLEK
jgi:ferredoxin